MWKNFILLITLICITFIFSKSDANELTLKDYAEVKDLSIEFEKAILSNRNYYLKDRESRNYSLNLNFDLDIMKVGFLNTRIESMTDKSQFRFIGLEFDTGVRLIKGVELYIKHFSGHLLDDTYPCRFPEDNSLGLRFRFIGER